MFAFQIYRNGFHGGLRQAAAMYRHFCRLKPSEVPLKQNGLKKTLGPAARSLMECRHTRRNPLRTDDYKVITQARRLICNHPLLNGKSLTEESASEVMGEVMNDIVPLLSKAESQFTIKYRLKGLEKHFKKNSFFPRLIRDQWETKFRKNSGNPLAVHTSPKEIENNNDVVDELIANCAPKSDETKGTSFWIGMGTTNEELTQIGYAREGIHNWNICDSSQALSMDFFVNMNFESFRNRLKKNKNSKGETKHTRATRYSEYGIQKDKCIFSDDKDTFWTSVHLKQKRAYRTR